MIANIFQEHYHGQNGCFPCSWGIPNEIFVKSHVVASFPTCEITDNFRFDEI